MAAAAESPQSASITRSRSVGARPPQGLREALAGGQGDVGAEGQRALAPLGAPRHRHDASGAPARAARTATCPTTPLAPSTTTVSPGASPPRSRTGIHPARPATPSATASSSEIPSGTGTSRSSGTATTSQSPPVRIRHHTRVPAGWMPSATSSPTISAPGTNGGSGSGM